MNINSINNVQASTNVTQTKQEVDHSVADAAVAAGNVPIPQLMHKKDFELSISEEAVVKAIEKANKAIAGDPHQFEYSVHKPSGTIVVKVVDAETKEVIREIPPEKILDIISKLQELSGGAIIDEKR